MTRRRRSPPTPRVVRIVTAQVLLSSRRRSLGRVLRVVLLLLLCAGVGLAAGLTFGPKAAGGAGGNTRRLDPTERLRAALHVITTHHVDNPVPDALIDAAINGALTALDRHSQFFDSTSYRRWRARIHGQKIGPGFDVQLLEGRFFLSDVVPSSPAASLGMVAGDEILALDGSPLDGLALGVVKKMLEGDEGTSILIRWRHDPHADLAYPPSEVTLIRTKRATTAVRSQVLLGGLLHVKVDRFQEGVAKDVLEQCRRFDGYRSVPLQGIILDLRGNLGGLLNEAILMADLFLPPDQVIVSLEGRKGKVLKVHASAAEQMLTQPLVILVDHRSASASEIVASALQDHRRALIVGHVSYGKGSVQSTYPLKDGSGLKITTSRYYSPLHRQIDDLGVYPDILVPDTAAPDMAPHLPSSPGDLNPVDPQDIPLQMAVGLLRSSRVLAASPSP